MYSLVVGFLSLSGSLVMAMLTNSLYEICCAIFKFIRSMLNNSQVVSYNKKPLIALMLYILSTAVDHITVLLDYRLLVLVIQNLAIHTGRAIGKDVVILKLHLTL